MCKSNTSAIVGCLFFAMVDATAASTCEQDGISAARQTMASIVRDGTVRLWDVGSGRSHRNHRQVRTGANRGNREIRLSSPFALLPPVGTFCGYCCTNKLG